MTASAILNITQIAEGQTNAYITANNQTDALEQAANAFAVNASVGGGPWELTEEQLSRNVLFVTSGASGNFDVECPSTINAVNTKRFFCVDNRDSTYTATVKAATGTGATVELAPDTAAVLYQDHEDIYLIAKSTAAAAANPYDIGAYIPGLPVAGAEVMKFIAPRAIELADDFADSRGHVGVNPTASAAFDVLKNGTSVGSITVSTGGVFTFATTGGGVSLAAGDRLSVTAPDPQDATLSGTSFVFAGTR